MASPGCLPVLTKEGQLGNWGGVHSGPFSAMRELFDNDRSNADIGKTGVLRLTAVLPEIVIRIVQQRDLFHDPAQTGLSEQVVEELADKCLIWHSNHGIPQASARLLFDIGHAFDATKIGFHEKGMGLKATCGNLGRDMFVYSNDKDGKKFVARFGEKLCKASEVEGLGLQVGKDVLKSVVMHVDAAASGRGYAVQYTDGQQGNQQKALLGGTAIDPWSQAVPPSILVAEKMFLKPFDRIKDGGSLFVFTDLKCGDIEAFARNVNETLGEFFLHHYVPKESKLYPSLHFGDAEPSCAVCSRTRPRTLTYAHTPHRACHTTSAFPGCSCRS